MLSDEKSVHIWIFDELLSLLRIDITAINHSDFLSKFGVNIFVHPVSDRVTGSLCLFRFHLTSLNTVDPDRLVA